MESTMNKNNPVILANNAWDKYTSKRNNLELSERGKAKVKIMFFANQWLKISKNRADRTFPTNKQFAKFANCSIRWVKRVFQNTGLKHLWVSITKIVNKKFYRLRAITGNVDPVSESIDKYIFKKVHGKQFKNKVVIPVVNNKELKNDSYIPNSIFDCLD